MDEAMEASFWNSLYLPVDKPADEKVFSVLGSSIKHWEEHLSGRRSNAVPQAALRLILLQAKMVKIVFLLLCVLSFIADSEQVSIFWL